MRIALCGSGGTGKTVTAMEIAGMTGYRHVQSQARIVYERHKTVSIERDPNQDPRTYVKVQYEILEEQIKTEEAASQVSENWIAERTVLDTAAYFSFWAAAKPLTGGEWKRCANLLRTEALKLVNKAMMHVVANPYDAVFVMPYGRVPLSHDAYRSGDAMYQRAIDMMIRGLIQQRLSHVAFNVPELEGNERQTAEWILEKCSVPKTKPSPGFADRSDAILEEVSRPGQRPECIVWDRVCDIRSGECHTCGRKFTSEDDQSQ